MDLAEQNREAWNAASKGECDWSIPVSAEEIKLAREGDFSVRLTPEKMTPHEWFPSLKGLEILCLASGGGQQVPLLAAAGAKVTSLDISDEQLSKDVIVAKQHDLPLVTVRGEMTDLSRFEAGSFDLIFNPASTLFVEDVKPVWEACYRVLRPGGILLSGSMNPSFFLFDHDEALKQGTLSVKFPLPYSDLKSLTDVQKMAMRKTRKTIEFGHSLEDLIGGQIRSGFHIAGFYEDYWDDSVTLLNLYSPTSFATRALKPER